MKRTPEPHGTGAPGPRPRGLPQGGQAPLLSAKRLPDAAGRAQALGRSSGDQLGDSGTTGASGVLPPYAAADSKLQDPPSLAAQGKKEEKEEREEGSHGEMQRDTDRETESMALSWDRQKEGRGEEGNLSPGRQDSSQNVEVNTRG